MLSSDYFITNMNSVTATGDNVLTMCVRQRNPELLEFFVNSYRMPVVFEVSKQNLLWVACFENIVEMIEPIVRLSKSRVCTGEHDEMHTTGKCVRYKK